jgi:gastric triacylglycerol lipase
VKYQKSKLVGLLMDSALDKVLVDLGIHEFMTGDTWLTSGVGRVFCAIFPSVCGDLIGMLVSADPKLDNYERYDVLAGHEPGILIELNLLFKLVQALKI